MNAGTNTRPSLTKKNILTYIVKKVKSYCFPIKTANQIPEQNLMLQIAKEENIKIWQVSKRLQNFG